VTAAPVADDRRPLTVVTTRAGLRDHVGMRGPRVARSRVVAGVVAVLVTLLGGTACSNAPKPAPAPSAQSMRGPAVPAVTMAKSDPVRVQIPAIGVDSELMRLGALADGTMEVPPVGFPAGWYSGAPTPGELGPAILAGHVDWAGRPGVFYRLRDLKPGDEITVARKDDTVAVFRVTRVEQFPKNSFPTDAVYGDIDRAGLRVITCGGTFDRRVRSYEANIVAFADLVGTDNA
jgi:Sortase domain